MGESERMELTLDQAEALNQLCANPQFQNLRNQILANPQGAQQVVPQLLVLIQQSHPQVAPIFQSNPQILMLLISQGRLNIQQVPGEQVDPQQPDNQQPGQNIPPPQTQPQPTIELTEDDRNNIDTIMSMGFNEQQAVEAYLVCNKNVELAINYLFDNA